ncbi:MAG: neutral/alkaline non-lysosomal ceramidase N-terminal domain-containing protein [Candidatus Bathyarchaeota archaeon]|nr:neutral/alkaline non-lysosomal ceramidase N-terminal domain-containing protein [Candidatus Bathyarchaeota archaeon]
MGVSTVDITPPIGIDMIGFSDREPSSIGVHDELKAISLVFSDGETKAALVSCDLLHMDASLVKMIRAEANTRTNIPENQITIACTHTHYGPTVGGFGATFGAADDVVAYRTSLKFLLAGAIQESFQNLKEAKVGIGWGTSNIGINRRERSPDGKIVLGQNPEGPVDRQVGLMKIERSDSDSSSCVVNFACHPVSQAWRMRLISADYPGKTRDVVGCLTGADFMFLQGACGNINPVLMDHSYEPARRLGTQLGCEVVKVWEDIEVSTVKSLALVSETIGIPAYNYGSEQRAEELARELESRIEKLEAEGAKEGSIIWAKRRQKRLLEALDSWRTGKPMPEIEAEIQAWKIGDLGIAFAPGEVFNEIGTHIKEHSPFPSTFFVGYANGNVGYIPTPEAYAEGGYEVEQACRVSPEAARLIPDKCLELLENLYQSA